MKNFFKKIGSFFAKIGKSIGLFFWNLFKKIGAGIKHFFTDEAKRIDWLVTIIPVVIITGLSIVFMVMPEQSNEALGEVRFFFGDKMGFFYVIFGVLFIFVAVYLAASKVGNVKLGKKDEKPKYSFFSWGSMMFTCGLAADILFYSLSEWVMYANETHLAELSKTGATETEIIQGWAGVFPLFHWSFIPWAFYLVLAVAFGFMLHVRRRERQRFSEACRPILRNQTQKIGGRIIDLFAAFALLAGTATTFTIATPLMANIVKVLFHIQIETKFITLIILLLTFTVYTVTLLTGFKGIGLLAKLCIIMFFGTLILIFFVSNRGIYILETGIESLGKMFQNFIGLATYTDPLRTSNFPQNWTMYYWAYWMVWCVAAPFFIGNISQGRTIRQVIIGGFAFGVGSTLVSFIVLGGYGMGLQTDPNSGYDFVKQYVDSEGDAYGVIIAIISSLPAPQLWLVLILVTMIMFYATSFDSIAYTASCYSYKKLEGDAKPHKLIQLLWCVLLILLPIALVFAESSINSLQTISIVSAFPLGLIMILIIVSFFMDVKKHMKGLNTDGSHEVEQTPIEEQEKTTEMVVDQVQSE